MSERHYEVRPVGVEYVCDQCGEGVMQASLGQPMVATYPPKYPHKCTSCGAEDSYLDCYPTIKWERVAP